MAINRQIIIATCVKARKGESSNGHGGSLKWTDTELGVAEKQTPYSRTSHFPTVSYVCTCLPPPLLLLVRYLFKGHYRLG